MTDFGLIFWNFPIASKNVTDFGLIFWNFPIAVVFIWANYEFEIPLPVFTVDKSKHQRLSSSQGKTSAAVSTLHEILSTL